MTVKYASIDRSSTIPTIRPIPLRAEIIGSDSCTAANVSTSGHAPVLALCRELLAAGLDPDTAMNVYRGAVLALRVRSIGEGARLEINGKGVGFVSRSAVGTASPKRNSPPRDAERHDREGAAP